VAWTRGQRARRAVLCVIHNTHKRVSITTWLIATGICFLYRASVWCLYSTTPIAHQRLKAKGAPSHDHALEAGAGL
jgi:hypothetical protein